MSWIRIASDLIREAISVSNEASESKPQEAPPPPADIVGLLHRHRVEIDKNFETVVQMLNAQNERHLHAMKIQKRWNYGLTAAVVVVTILAIAGYWY